MVLKFKAADKWTGSEIQEHIDHYKIEIKEQELDKLKCPKPVAVQGGTAA